MKLAIVLALMILCGCVVDLNNDGYRYCGPLPRAPYWEYTEEGGAPAQAKIPLHLWLQDLQWRKDVRAWAECVSPGSAENNQRTEDDQ